MATAGPDRELQNSISSAQILVLRTMSFEMGRAACALLWASTTELRMQNGVTVYNGRVRCCRPQKSRSFSLGRLVCFKIDDPLLHDAQDDDMIELNARAHARKPRLARTSVATLNSTSLLNEQRTTPIPIDRLALYTEVREA